MNSLRLIFKTMRPKQWTKNVFVWAALIFDGKLFKLDAFSATLLTFVLFCLMSSVVYLINDLVDIPKDRQHPSKRNRPLASGALRPRAAILAALLIGLATIPAALSLGLGLALILYGYLVLMIAYSFWLKNIVIVDVLTLAAGFVLRVAAGVVVIQAERFSPWIYVCMVLLALFLGLGKRRQEIVLLNGNTGETRAILEEYNLRFVDEMLALVSSSTVMAYSLYTFSAPNLPGNHAMMFTIPFVLYALFRYLYLIHVRGETEPPDVVVLQRPTAADRHRAVWGDGVPGFLCVEGVADQLRWGRLRLHGAQRGLRAAFSTRELRPHGVRPGHSGRSSSLKKRAHGPSMPSAVTP